MPTFWQTVDNIHVTYDALEVAQRIGVKQINYDASGIGNTVTSTLVHANTGDVTVSPSTDSRLTSSPPAAAG